MALRTANSIGKYDHLIGTPFAYGGRSIDAGFDCYGLVRHLYESEHGVVLPDYHKVSDNAQIHAMMASQIHLWAELKKQEIGSVALFNIYGLMSHVGYVINDLQFIHTWEKTGGVVIEPLSVWKNKIVGFYKYER